MQISLISFLESGGLRLSLSYIVVRFLHLTRRTVFHQRPHVPQHSLLVEGPPNFSYDSLDFGVRTIRCIVQFPYYLFFNFKIFRDYYSPKSMSTS